VAILTDLKYFRELRNAK